MNMIAPKRNFLITNLSNYLFLFRMTKLSSEFDKLNLIIQELRKENQSLKQVNYELEINSKNALHS